MIERIVQEVERGGNPLDAWSPEWTFGFPMLRVYQTGAHLFVALIYFLLFKAVPLITVLSWIRFLAILLLPLSFYICGILMELGPSASLCSAIIAPLVSSNLYGIEASSYVWAGYGLFPQSVAVNLLLLSLGFGWRALKTGKGLKTTGVLLGLTAITHLIFGYMGAVTLVIFGWRKPKHVAFIAAIAICISAFQILPLLIDSPIINHSRWEPAWKWDGYGLNTIRMLPDFLDAKRLPILFVLALIGCIITSNRVLMLCACFWTLLLFGRPVWGDAINLLGISPDFHIHRLVAGVQIFLVFLAGIALSKISSLANRRWKR